VEITAKDILEMLRAGDERVEIEAKRGSSIDKSIMESVCAMANEPFRGGMLEQKGQSTKTYYVAGPIFIASLSDEKSSMLKDKVIGLSEELNPLSIEQTPLITELKSLSIELPEELKVVIDALGHRTAPNRLDEAMLALCRWRQLTIEELQFLLQRKHDAVRRSIRRQMAAGRLDYLYPDNPTHPNQKYRVIEGEGDNE
jgi:ATP-dependent DNA helicase RecG